MIWLGIDFETTGLSSTNDHITEIGAVIWDTDTKQPVKMMNELLYWPDMEVSSFITKLTGITKEMCEKWGADPASAAEKFNNMFDCADYAMAHNAPFDKGFYEDCLCKRTGIDPRSIKWIDTRTDIPYPEETESRKLGHLAMQHGFLNPFPHRAMTDVLTMLKVASHYNPEDIIGYQDAETLEIRAMVTFNNKEKAKARGFKWSGSPRKIWTKNIKDFQLDKEKEEADFPITVTKGDTSENNN